jgi:signal transduction histidine kinase
VLGAASAKMPYAHQIVSNLYSNSVKHTRRGVIRLAGRRNGGAALIEVVDSGTGISERDAERLFDRFYRSNPTGEGFGLGLSIVRQSVAALGGTVSIAPRAEGGTRAAVQLPVADGEAG